MAPWLYRRLEHFDDIVLHPRAEESAVGGPLLLLTLYSEILRAAHLLTWPRSLHNVSFEAQSCIHSNRFLFDAFCRATFYKGVFLFYNKIILLSASHKYGK